MSVLIGFHPIREALRAGSPLDRVLVARGMGGPRVQEIVDLCRDRNVAVRFETRDALDRLGGKAHQGLVAFGAAHRYATLESVWDGARLLVVLDGVEDPHNLGAILRTANGAGAAAVLVPERRSVGITETVAKASAGAIEHTPVVKIGNVSRTLEQLKERGYWVYGLDERARERHDRVAYNEPTVLVFGGEGHGLHQIVQRHCDSLVSIPMAGAIPSLNVSVAVGVVLYEWARQKSG